MIRWETIINGYTSFEALAMQYVAATFKFPYGEWKETQATRDGNKDAYTVIVGYHPFANKEETWWMEAKYSSPNPEKTKYLTRYRLDATIVSSIFHKRVSKIIFVTNIDIHSKTMSDIRVALQKAIACEEVYFCTKQVIEYWLYQNPKVYNLFFPNPLPKKFKNKALFVSEDINVYPYPSDHCYIEPCTHVYMDKVYQAYFKIVSAKAREVFLVPAQSGIEIMSGTTLRLDAGENAVRVLFRVNKHFVNDRSGDDGRIYRRLDLFEIDKKCQALLKKPIEILQRMDFHLAIQSQEHVVSTFTEEIEEFRVKPDMHIFLVHGESGTGKSHVVRHCIGLKPLCNEHTYYHSFSADHRQNAKHVLDVVFFLLFPYLNPDEIDTTYLSAINGSVDIPRDLIHLAEYCNDPNGLELAFQRHCEVGGSVFPKQCAINPRYVFLDNIQNLNDVSNKFILSIINESHKKACPFFFVFIGQNHVIDSSFYRDLRQKYSVTVQECAIEADDIISSIQSVTSVRLDLSPDVVGDYFPNLIVLIDFLRYVSVVPPSELGNLSDFLTLYIAYINGNMAETLVLDQFENAMTTASMRKLCFAVYTAPNGVSIESVDYVSASALLKNGLIRFNEKNQLVPFHEIYENIFRRANKVSKLSLGLEYTNTLDQIRDTMLFSVSQNDFFQEAQHITQLRKDGRFHSVCYILEPFFDVPHTPNSARLRGNPQYVELYYQLYFDFAYAAVNCSHRCIGYDSFEKIYQEIEGKTSVKMRLLKLELLFELMNSNYNVFKYKEAMQRYRQFMELYGLLSKTGHVAADRSENTMYILCQNMRILIQSSRGKKRSEQMFLRWRKVLRSYSHQYHYVDFCIRYAHTLYTVDIQRALRYTEEACSYLPEEDCGTSKLWCLARFQYLYLHILIYKDYRLLEELENVVELAKKEYYSSYRHRNMALCAVLYVVGDVQKADERFFKDMASPRKPRQKLQAFYFQTFALHLLAHNKIDEAATALTKASDIFHSMPSYLRTIDHNQKVLSKGLFSASRIDYNLGGRLKRDWYYVDPRSD